MTPVCRAQESHIKAASKSSYYLQQLYDNSLIFRYGVFRAFRRKRKAALDDKIGY